MTDTSIQLRNIGLRFPKQRNIFRILLGLFKRQKPTEFVALEDVSLESEDKVRWLASSDETGQENPPY